MSTPSSAYNELIAAQLRKATADLRNIQQLLTQEEVSKLIDARERYGLTGPSKSAPSCPVTAGSPPPSSRESAPTATIASKAAEAKPQDGSGKITVTREELAAIVEDALRQTGKRRW